ncbi:uncharacterized protein [Macrobrachium rosenbergii]|uniref:uncharacterized protein n=1 Tax=Macrobrachium rosenbergii TaxID=79674 RepID=UPI0034D3B2BC
MVGVVKRTLATTLRCAIFLEEQLRTLIKKAEVVINNRPLMYAGDTRENEVLTPSHLIRSNMICLLPPVVPHEEMYATLTSRQLRHIYFCLTETLERFKTLWRDGYLKSLRERHDCKEGMPTPLHVGDIVLVKADNSKRSQWPLGRILEIYPDEKWVIHSVKILIEGEEHLRSVEHLMPLKLSEHEADKEEGTGMQVREQSDDSDNDSETGSITHQTDRLKINDREVGSDMDEGDDRQVQNEVLEQTAPRPRRRAATEQRRKMAEWIRDGTV